MHTTAPLLLGNRPSSLPVREAICAVVWICGAWCFGGLPAHVVVLTTPRLLIRCPLKVLANRAVEGVVSGRAVVSVHPRTPVCAQQKAFLSSDQEISHVRQ